MAALAALVSGGSQQQAADTAGVSRMTLTRWLRDRTFRDQLAQAEVEASREILAGLRAALPRAVSALVELLDSPDSRERVKAASALLRTAGWFLPRPDAQGGAGITRTDAGPSDPEPRPGWDPMAGPVEIVPADEPGPPADPMVQIARGVRVNSGQN